MKFLLGSICIVGLVVNDGFAADTNLSTVENTSPLIGDGPLQTIRAPLAAIFQFAVDGDQLQVNRAAWDRVAKEIAKNPPPVANAGNAFGAMPVPLANRVVINRNGGFGGQGAASPLEAMFQQIERQVQVGSRSMSSGSGGSNTTRTNQFSSDSLSGQLSVSGESIRLSFGELVSLKRTLQFSTEPDAGFHLQLTHPDGDMILLSENQKGRFTVVGIVGKKAFANQADSFLAFYKQNRQQLETDVLPGVAQFGICPILSADSPEVERAALAVLLRTPETTAEGKKLLDQLDSDSAEDRESAANDLMERFLQFSDLVDQRISDKATSAETRNRLQALAESQTGSQQARQTIALLNLLNDPKYIISILDEVAPHENIKLIKRLEEITGEKLGPDHAEWQRWAKKNLK